MFTGIIEEIGTIKKIKKENRNLIIYVKSSFLEDLKINQSISHNGICLTVTELNADNYGVCVVDETIKKTNIGLLKEGGAINLERCLLIGERLDGHFVQGHIDTTIEGVKITDKNGSWMFKFKYEKNYGNYIISKGSIAINGVSLTIANINDIENCFEVAIIPYTFNNTNFKFIKEGYFLNVEFDILAKQISRLNERK